MSSAPVSRLLVLRHAHSSWALPGQRDHQRPLDERGRSDAARLGAEIARRGLAVEHVVCSTAERARETLEGIRPALPAAFSEETSDDLYALGPDAYLAAVRAAAGVSSLLLVGHNPMVEEFVAAIAPEGEAEALAILAEGYPTAGLALIDLPAPLAEARHGLGRLAGFVHPKGLPG